MTLTYADFEKLKRFVSFDDDDVARLRALAGLMARIGPLLTDAFYEVLGSEPETAQIIDGRIEALKTTHRKWLQELVAGDYGEDYFRSRIRIGQIHVIQDLAPAWVEAVMSIIRTKALQAMAMEFTDSRELASSMASFLKICDLDMLLINMAYADERLERLSSFTGMKRALIENIIRIPPLTPTAEKTC